MGLVRPLENNPRGENVSAVNAHTHLNPRDTVLWEGWRAAARWQTTLARIPSRNMYLQLGFSGRKTLIQRGTSAARVFAHHNL